MAQKRLSVSTTNALHGLDEVLDIFARSQRRLVLFSDYDGTLTEIVSNPDKAFLSESMRDTLVRLKERFGLVGLISGRSIEKLKGFVQLDSLYYAGSHGFDICGPAGCDEARLRHSVSEQAAGLMAQVKEALEKRLREEQLAGVWVEDNKFALSVHIRHAEEAHVCAADRIVDDVMAEFPGQLRRSSGKMVYEIKPNIAWNKGRALLWLLDAAGVDKESCAVVYIGDDTTDEDVFEVLRWPPPFTDTDMKGDCGADSVCGLGIAVTEQSKHSMASMTLRNPVEVLLFLQGLADRGISST